MNISIALCTYNGAQHLLAQLASIRHQTRLPYELVVCDDASTDETLTIMQTFAETADFPVHIHQNPQNIGSTRNFEQAIHLCAGEIIVLADQDDVWMPNKLAIVAQQFDTNPIIGGIFTDALVVDEHLADLGYRLWSVNDFTPSQQDEFKQGQVIPILLKKNVVTGATLAFRAELRERLLPISPLWVHDGWLAFILACTHSLSLLPIPEKTMLYRQHTHAQLGAEKITLSQALVEPTEAQRYQHMVDQYQDLHAHLVKLDDIDAEILALIAEKIAHMQKRAHLPDRRLARLKSIINEIWQGRYQRYSVGWRSVLRDLQRS